MEFNKVSVIGLGYIGLPTAAMLASRKIEVVGVDINQNTVDTINRGEIHIVEPDLDMVVHAAVTEGYLRARTQPEPADVFMVAVPTPFKGEDHEPDLSYIEAAAKSIAPVLSKGNLLILESTSPVGSTEQFADWLAAERPDLTFPATSNTPDIHVAHCPERVLPGRILHELVANDRIIGGLTPTCAELATKLYKTFVKGECLTTNARTAEMAKLTENAFRDVNIAFANELSMICDDLDINVWELIKLANRHPRVNILQPGPGVGGHCIAVDPWFIISKAPEEAKLMKIARRVNVQKELWAVDKVKQAIDCHLTENPSKNVENVIVGCYGLTFKPNVDDLRESPALAITREIAAMQAVEIWAVEPNIDRLPDDLCERVALKSLSDAMEKADINVLLVDHREFQSATPKGGSIIDFRGTWTFVEDE